MCIYCTLYFFSFYLSLGLCATVVRLLRAFYCFRVDLKFGCDKNDTAASVIVGKISDLLIGDRLWPNCLNRPIRNSIRMKIDDFMARFSKLSM